MLRHIVMWNFKDGLTEAENQANAERVKAELEALKSSIPEIIKLQVHINPTQVSNMDIMLDSLFENEETMKVYKMHPEHLKLVEFIGSILQNRMVFDYYE